MEELDKIEEGDESTAPPAQGKEKERRLSELRSRLDTLTDITDESEQFRVERHVCDLEHAAAEDEWPEIIRA